MSKNKIKHPKKKKDQMLVKMVKQSKPKFMHNAKQAGTLPTWTYSFWNVADPSNKGLVEINMTRNMYGNENVQAKQMSAAAIAEVKSHYSNTDVKVTR